MTLQPGTQGTITAGASKGRHGTVCAPPAGRESPYWVRLDAGAVVGPFYAEPSFRPDAPAVAWGCNAVSSYEDAGLGTGLARARALGLGWDRPYAQDPGDIAWWKAAAAQVSAAGLRPLVCLERRPYGADFPSVAARLVSALKPLGVTHYEVLNEPELAGVEPADYARLFRDTVTACRKADPAARFLACSAPDVTVAGAWTQWPTAMAAAVPGLASLMDGWACHPYGSLTSTSHSWGGGWNLLDYQRGLWLKAGIDRPCWITEVGMKVGASDGVNKGPLAEQADRVRFYVAECRRRPWVAGFFWFQWGNYGADEEWGLTAGRNGALRPAGQAYMEAIR